MTADVLSDVLRAVRLTGAVYFDYELSSPWVAEAPASREIAAVVMPGAERVMEYHLIARGNCWGHMVGAAPTRLHEGDLLRFLDDLRSSGSAFYAVRKCSIHRAAPALRGKCEIDLITIVDRAAKA